MAEERYFVVTRTAPRQIQPRDGRAPFDLLEVFDDQGSTWVARQDVFNLASQWVGMRVRALTRTEQKGNFTNRFIDSIELAGAQVPSGQGSYQPVQQAQQAQQPQLSTPVIAPSEAERQRSIHRQTAAKVAAKMSTTPIEFWENLVTINHYFETGQIPRWIEQQAQQQQDQNDGSRQNAEAYRQFSDPGPQPGQYDQVPY